MKKVFLFLASCLVTFATGAKTVSVSNSDLEWEENTSGEMEARIVIGDIGCSDVTLNFTGGNASKVPCYRVAIIDNGDPEYDYWHELSDWNDILEVNSSGNGSTTISLTACGQTNRVIAFFIQLDKNPNIPQYTVSVQSEYSWKGTVTGSGTYDKGETVKITATPYEERYVFKEWSDGNTDNPRYITVTSDIELVAYFKEADIQYEINSDGRTVTLTNVRNDIEVANIPSSVTIDGNTYTVTKIGGERMVAFHESSVTSITIPNTVSFIQEGAFDKCENIRFIKVADGNTTFDSRDNCNAIIETKTNTLIVGSSNTIIPNTVTSIGQYAFEYCSGLTSITIPNSVTSIGEWAFFICKSLSSVIIPNSVTSIGAFAFSGCYSLYSITIPSSVKTIEEYTFSECGSLRSVNISDGVTSIGEFAFEYCESLESITIPSSVTSIGGGAFDECTILTSITCLAKTPPTLAAEGVDDEGDIRPTFYNNGAYITVYVPAESLSAYKSAPVWKTLNIQPIPAENVSLSKDEVVVNVEKTTADFSMPANESANSYTLTIRNNGVTFCTLTFNANGQLTDIDFSTTKSYELKADVSAFKFTVTGLSEASDYRYSFKVLNASKAVLKEYVGSFTTKNADGTGGSTSGGGEGTLAVDAVSNATAVTIVNGQILVNGEAPAFVVTVAGQKIANANLKAGVYFVVADGKTVGVSVR